MNMVLLPFPSKKDANLNIFVAPRGWHPFDGMSRRLNMLMPINSISEENHLR